MAPLSNGLRRLLEKTVVEAREVAEAAARTAFKRLAVEQSEPCAGMTPAERQLRVTLRAHARQLGDAREPNGEQQIGRLVAGCAYAHWHRMLFARFLAETGLLIDEELGVPVTLAECEELAAAIGENDRWALAGRFAARMLPAIFRSDDPVLAVRLAPEHQQRLEALLTGLPAQVFTADDGLGWVYQFWQAKRKTQVNEAAKGGRKIGADELPAVTQLFTESYMVKFLLHNTLGAWWAGKVLGRPGHALAAASEEELRHACALPGYEWSYLRFVRRKNSSLWHPAAGTFEGWPKRAAEISVLDPCCGSGHFLVEAFRILVPMRMVEEGLSAQEACDAVMRDNLFGLEIDERCTQIAAFNLALAAWTYPESGGHRPLPELHIACSGLAVGASKDDWTKPASNCRDLRVAMGWLYDEFQHAPILGSLLDPTKSHAAKLTDWQELRPLLEQVLARHDVQRDAQATEVGIAAQGMAKAAALLVSSYTLVATNVPYLGRGKQDEVLKDYCEREHPAAKADLATCFVERCLGFCMPGGTTALVTPQNWLFLGTYKKLREKLLKECEWNAVARLGSRAFETVTGEVVNVALLTLTAHHPRDDHAFLGLDASDEKTPSAKAAHLCGGEVVCVGQREQLRNPDAKMCLSPRSHLPLLGSYAHGYVGIQSGDDPRFVLRWWELGSVRSPIWEFIQMTPTNRDYYSGLTSSIYWNAGTGDLHRSRAARLQGLQAVGCAGIAMHRMREVVAYAHSRERFHQNVVVIVPRNPLQLPAIWCFCSSPQFALEVRKIDQTLKVTNATLVEVPFDLAHWHRVAAERYPNGLPKPFSDDPTQWVFHGHPCGSVVWDEEKGQTIDGSLRIDETVLQVAVVRLLGYRWPAELNPKMELATQQREWVRRCEELVELADEDGIVCIPPVRGEQPAAERLQRLLARTYGPAWNPTILSALLERVGFAGRMLGDWLRDGFFEQHCELFHQRPFIWHIWDGHRDGFAALVNYHKLDRKLLERLTYTVLGDWIEQQRRGIRAGEHGTENRLAKAEALQKKLALILEGEPPYDIFVRWKPLHEQPVGWEPDLNDGVRVGIRPFVEAGVLRKNPRIQWTKDRGKEPESLRPEKDFPWFWKDGTFVGERVNDVHLRNAEKRAARRARY